MKQLLSIAALVLTSGVLAANGVFAAGLAAHHVSNGDPFVSCTNVGGDGTGLNYRSTEIEPWLADNPANPENVIGSWQQDRWSDGGAKGLVASASFNSGRSWKEVPLPFSRCAQPYYGARP